VAKIENVTVRELKIWDLIKLIRWYRNLSNESKHFFHPFPETLLNPRFFITWIVLSLSCIKFLRKIFLKILPQLTYISVCSVYLNEIVGFAFIKLRNRYYGELGIGVRDEFQGMGIGSMLMEILIALARKEGLKRIGLTVLADNYKALRLYEKFGFKKIRYIKNGDVYRGKKYDCIEMQLNLQ